MITFTLRVRAFDRLLFLTVCCALLTSTSFGWTGPTAAPPNNNAAEPINISGTQQFKPGVIGANILNIYGASQYLNFGNTTGTAGFGLRNNGGVLEFKNSGGNWAALGSSQWTTSGSNIYYGGGNVGIGTTAPGATLDANGGALFGSTYRVGIPAFGNSITFSRSSMNYIDATGASGSLAFRTGGIDNTDMFINAAGNVGISIGTAVTNAKLTVGGTAGSANQSYYDIGADRIAANSSVYSYGRICAGNAAGNCLGVGGTVLRSDGLQFPDGTLQTTAAGAVRRSAVLGLPVPPSGLSQWPEIIRCHVPAHDNVHLQFLQGTNTAATQVYYRGGANYDAYVGYNISDGAFVVGDNSTSCYYKSLQTLCGEGNCFY